MLKVETPDEFGYATSTAANMQIARAMGEIRFAEKMQVLMPMVAQELVKAGVDFSKVTEPPCPKCGQRDEGQTGEYPCEVCGLPLTHDAAAD